MNLKRTAVSAVGGGAVVVWIATAATSVPRSAAPVRPSLPHPVEVSGAQLAAEIARLHERLHPTTAPLESRDLFAYTPRGASASRRAPESHPAPIAALETPMTPPLKLVGIAEDGPADAVVRTAVISGLGDLFLVKAGESVGARYRVLTVAPNAVELIDSSNQSAIRLTLP